MASCKVLLAAALCASVAYFCRAEISEITTDAFNKKINKALMVVVFYKEGDKNQKAFSLLEKYGTTYTHSKSTAELYKFDCGTDKKFCEEHEVEETPLIKFYGRHHPDGYDFDGEYTEEEIKEFLEEEVEEDENPTPVHPPKDEKPPQEQSHEEEEDSDSHVVKLTDKNYRDKLAKGYHFVKFYSPGCGFCVQLAPTWERLAQDYAGNKNIVIAKADCTTEREVCQKYPVGGFPTLLLIRNGDVYQRFDGKRSPQAFEDFIKKYVKGAKKTPASSSGSGGAAKVAMNVLTTKNFRSKTARGLWFIKFYSPNCGFCTMMADDWAKLGEKYKDNQNINIAKINCVEQKKACEEQNVWGYPGLWLYKDGQQHKEFMKDRTVSALSSFINENLPKAPKKGKDEL